MSEKRIDWVNISNHPKFVELYRKRTTFLVSLWVVGVTSYFLVLVGAMFAPALFNTRIFGRLNFGYLFCVFQFILAWAIAIIYTHRSNTEFDPLMEQLVDLIGKGEAK